MSAWNVLLFTTGKVMIESQLDPRKLLGFKIITNGDSKAMLRSPKIGHKSCTVVEAMQAIAGSRAATKI